MNTFIILLCTLKKYHIKAVCIFDGPNPPIEKKLEQDRRRAEGQKQISRLKECIRIRDLIQDKYLPFGQSPPEQIQKDCKLLVSLKRGSIDKTDYTDSADLCDALNVTIEKLKLQTMAITDKHKECAKKIVEMFGFACFQADGEAETLCAYLAVKGKVDAVLTEDTDVLPYGTPLMLAFKDFKLSDNKVRGLYLPSVLKSLNLNQEEFRDLCILLSCDYNNRVKGFPPDGKNRKKPIGLGVKGAWDMINVYRRLEKAEKYMVDPDPLKYRRCRELLTIPKSIPNIEVPYDTEPHWDELEEWFKIHRLTVNMEYVLKFWKPIELIFEDDSDDEDNEDSSNTNDNEELFVDEYSSEE